MPEIGSLWSIMEDETTCDHLKQEACKMADYITRERGNQKTLKKSKLDQQTCEKLDENSFWSIMNNEDMHAHLKEEAYKVADLIARDWGRQKKPKSKVNQRTCENLDENSFWSLMEDKDVHAHLKQEAYKVADLIARESGKLRLCLSSSPEKSLDHILKLLGSDDWQKKMYGLTCIQDLARNHPDVLKTTLRRVCVGVMEEVKNPQSSVPCAALATLAEMYAHLQRTMDDMVEETGSVLILKVSESNNVVQQQANLALDTMVKNCSPGRTMNALLNAGLSHHSAAVRESAARHLSQLCDILGATQTLSGGKDFTKHFLIALRKICVEASGDVRRHGHVIVQNISNCSAFQEQWKEAVPEKDRCSLEGLMKELKTDE